MTLRLPQRCKLSDLHALSKINARNRRVVFEEGHLRMQNELSAGLSQDRNCRTCVLPKLDISTTFLFGAHTGFQHLPTFPQKGFYLEGQFLSPADVAFKHPPTLPNNTSIFILEDSYRPFKRGSSLRVSMKNNPKRQPQKALFLKKVTNSKKRG